MDALSAVLLIDGQEHRVACSDCVAYTEGEFRGNIEFTLKAAPPIDNKQLFKHLKIKAAGGPLLGLIATGGAGAAVRVSFCSEELERSGAAPAEGIQIFWKNGEAPFAALPCRAAATPVTRESVELNHPEAGSETSGCYARFSLNGGRFEIGERRWILGVILMLMFSPGWYAAWPRPGRELHWAALAILSCLYALALWVLGAYKRAVFDRSTRSYSLESGFFFLGKVRQGPLSEIRGVRYAVDLTTGASGRASATSSVYVLLPDGEERIASSGPGSSYGEAVQLSRLIGCNFQETRGQIR